MKQGPCTFRAKEGVIIECPLIGSGEKRYKYVEFRYVISIKSLVFLGTLESLGSLITYLITSLIMDVVRDVIRDVKAYNALPNVPYLIRDVIRYVTVPNIFVDPNPYLFSPITYLIMYVNVHYVPNVYQVRVRDSITSFRVYRDVMLSISL